MLRYLIISLLTTGISANELLAQSSMDSTLINDLAKMVIIDQVAATNATPKGQFADLTLEEWTATKDSIYKAHKTKLEIILNERGYPGYDVVGKRGEQHFWLMVQHSDFDPQFQQRVLNEMLKQVERNNASAQNYAYLTDRVKLNLGEKQVYGTQVTYNLFTGKAKPKALMEPENVNKNRIKVGLDPLEIYLEEMTKMHMEGTITGVITNPTLLMLIIILSGVSIAFIIKRKRSST